MLFWGNGRFCPAVMLQFVKILGLHVGRIGVSGYGSQACGSTALC